jgi:hypothetical protein
MKSQETSIKFTEQMSAGGSLANLGAGITSNPETIPIFYQYAGQLKDHETKFSFFALVSMHRFSCDCLHYCRLFFTEHDICTGNCRSSYCCELHLY